MRSRDWRVRNMTHAAAGTLGVFLVVALGFIESGCRCNFGNDRLFVRWCHVITYLFGCLALFIRKIEDCGAVIVANVGPLPIELGRVVHTEKVAHKLLIGNVVGVELYQHCLSVARGMRHVF